MYFQTELFHRVLLPNLQVSVRSALTTFETKISPWTHPLQWLDANTNHLRSIFRAIILLTQEADIGEMSFPETMIHQRLIVYIFAHNMFASRDKTLLGKLTHTLKEWQKWDIVNLIRNQKTIRKRLLTLFWAASHGHGEKHFEDLLKRLLILDSIALSAHLEAIVVDERSREEVVETKGVGAQSLLNLLHSRLHFPMDPTHKLLFVQAVTDLLKASKLYPDSITLIEVTLQRGRRAAGGFGDVYKGTCFGEEVALKAFRLPLPSGATTLTSLTSFDNRAGSFLSELVLWRRLSHPNVLPFYGVHFLDTTLETRFCLVCPWMENGNVVEFLERQNREAPDTDATDCVSLALDIARGVEYLHGEKIIHRDLKGSNILISPSMRAYIADFGLATVTDTGSARTLTGSTTIGTPRWLAPEFFFQAGVKRQHTYATDIYAFALVCYEMFSGKLPFADVDEMYDIIPLLQQGERPSLPEDELSQRRGLSPEMEDLIRDCWAQELKERPSADKIVERLQLLCPDQPVDQGPLNEIATSFSTKVLRSRVDNPFGLLSMEFQELDLQE